ncbi:Hypothetical_protein [Hexamita inflata]|uniref:Hypothetical_protein n=1 Tax=Hexamita inflata TaxID=28002 RepID=A0ABP1JA81_9EUKA
MNQRNLKLELEHLEPLASKQRLFTSILAIEPSSPRFSELPNLPTTPSFKTQTIGSLQNTSFQSQSLMNRSFNLDVPSRLSNQSFSGLKSQRMNEHKEMRIENTFSLSEGMFKPETRQKLRTQSILEQIKPIKTELQKKQVQVLKNKTLDEMKGFVKIQKNGLSDQQIEYFRAMNYKIDNVLSEIKKQKVEKDIKLINLCEKEKNFFVFK